MALINQIHRVELYSVFSVVLLRITSYYPCTSGDLIQGWRTGSKGVCVCVCVLGGGGLGSSMAAQLCVGVNS